MTTFTKTNEIVVRKNNQYKKTISEELCKINDKFNRQLRNITETNSRSVILSLGKPSCILLAAGIEGKLIRLYGSKLASKIKKHGFSTIDLLDLPIAVANPVAVFKGNHPDTFAILTEIRVDNMNLLATLEVGKGSDTEFNIITSIYGKANKGIVNWINKGQLCYVDKTKTLDYLRISALIAEAQNSQGINFSVKELLTATKIVENFRNPKLSPLPAAGPSFPQK